jgi:magnesium and cobalt transporter
MPPVTATPSPATLLALYVAYVLFTLVRTTIVARAAARPAETPTGETPALSPAVLNTLFIGDVALVVAVAAVGAAWLRTWAPAVPTVVFVAAVAGALFLTRALVRVILPRSAAATFGAFALPVVKFVYLLLFPFLWLARAAARLVATLTRAGGDAGAIAPAAEVLALDARGAAPLAEDEREMLDGIISIRDTVAREVMVPRVDMVTADVRDSLAEIKRLVVAKGVSRVPVVDETPDDVVGILHAKDIFRLEESGADIRTVLRPPVFVPETKKVNEILREFRAAKMQLAIVVDEYGGTAGLITLEDVLEEIVGEIHDEYDAVVKLLEEVGRGAWLIAGRMDIGELNEKLGTAIPEEDFETVGGFVSALAGKVPAVGEKLTYGNLAFEITAADARRVNQVRLTITDDKEGRGTV